MNHHVRMFGLVVALLGLPAAVAAQDASFTVGPVTVQPGQRVSGFLEVPAGVDEGTRIPFTLVHGSEPGPVLALIAGTHGYEYAPILALQWMRPQIRPENLTGTVILVHNANLPSFLG
ncbi:MAG: succinylglutamate desuccinylase/aspartoacylase family protein, partial [Candidatus Acidiferrales bacterium]